MRVGIGARTWRGLSKGKRARDFDREALREGTGVELEHTKNRRLAERIAMDHLTEDARYYRKLRRVERR
jgi:uncharacterized protein DUF5661